MAVDVSRIPNNNKFDPVREAILQLQTDIEDTGNTIGNGTLTISTSSPLTGSGTFTANQTGPTSISIGIDGAEYLTNITHDTVNQKLVVTYGDGTTADLSLAQYIDDTNLARLVSGSLDSQTGIATFTRDDSTTFTVDLSALFDDTDTNDFLTSASFSTANGIITFGVTNQTSVTVDIDGRYPLIGDLTAVSNDIITSADFSATDNRFKLTLTQADAGTIEASFDDVVLSESMAADYIPYVKVGGGDGDTTNAVLNDSFLKINGSTLELDWGDTVGVYTARDIKMRKDGGGFGTYYEATYAADSVSFLHYASASDIDTAKIGATSAGRIRINDTYSLPVGDGTSGQVLSTNGSGDLSWVAAGGPTTSDLQDVTDNGPTTTNSITVNGLTSNDDITTTGNLFIGTVGQQNWIAFSGTTGDGGSSATYTTTYIGERIYGGTERSELIIYKGNDGHDSTASPDRIRMIGANLCFDTYNIAQGYPTDLDGVAALTTTRAMTIDTNQHVSITNGNLAVETGVIKIGTTTVIDASRNLTNMGAGSFGGNVTFGGYIDVGSTLYSRSNLEVLNAAGTGWNRWATRSNGQYNLDIGSLDVDGNATFNSVAVFNGQVNYNSEDRSAYWSYDNKVAAVFKPAADDGAVAILFPSIGNSVSDFGYIAFDEDYGEAGVTAGENSVLLIGCENDGGGSSDHVRVKGRLVVEADMSSSDPTNAFQVKDGNVTGDLFRVARSGAAVFSSTLNVADRLSVDDAIRLTSNPSITGDSSGVYFWNQAGVGATIASNAFEVRTNGNTTAFSIDNALNATFADDLTVGSYLYVGGSTGISSAGWIHLHRYASNLNVAVGNNGTNVNLLVPNGYLTVGGSGTFDGIVRSEYDSTHYAQLESNASGGVVKGIGGNGFMIRSYGESYFNGGDVGIGVTSPAHKLHIDSNSNSAYPTGWRAGELRVANDNSSNVPYQTANIVLSATGWAGGTTGVAQLSVIQDGSNVSNGTFTIKVRNNGTHFEAFRIKYDGNVGIGTTSPSAKLNTNLSVEGSILPYLAGTAYTFDGDANIAVTHNSSTMGTGTAAGLLLANNNNSNNAISPLIAFSARSASNSYNHTYAAIYGQKRASGADSNWNRGDLIFATANSTGPQERMRILDGGNVGIGTTSPNYNVHIATAGRSYLGISNQGSANGDRQLRLGFADGDTVARIQGTRLSVADDVDIVLQGGGGDVGIGRNPSYKLDVNGNLRVGTSSTVGELNFTTDNLNYIHYSGGSCYFRTNGGVHYFEGSSSYKGAWNNSGYLGVGETNPQQRLHVNGVMRWGSSSYYAYSGIDGGGLYIEQVDNNTGRDRIRLQTRTNNSGTYTSFVIDAGEDRFEFANGDVSLGREYGVTQLNNNKDWANMTSGIVWREYNHALSVHPANSDAMTEMIKGATFTEQGIVSNVNSFTRSDETYVVEFLGYYYAAVNGVHEFSISSDDAGDIFIDGTRVGYWYGGHGDNDNPTGGSLGSGGTVQTPGSIYLVKGFHRIYARYEEIGGGDSASLWQKEPSGAWEKIPSTRFYHKADDLFRATGSGNATLYGTFTATADIVAYSDERIKENVETIDNALDKVQKLRGVSFNRKKDGSKSIGVIAQEIEKVLPEVVTEDDKGIKGVAYGNVVGVLIEAIKEQQKQIDELKAIINGGS